MRKGENIDDLLKAEESGASEPKEDAPAFVEEIAAPVAAVANTVPVENDGFVKASPLAKKMATEKGINIASVQGTGPEGRVIKKDIESFKGGKPDGAKAVIQPGVDTEVPHSMMRKAIARRLSESKFTAPHFYLTMDIDMENAMSGRAAFNEVMADEGIKVSFNHLVIKAAAVAMQKHPKVNSLYTEKSIIYKGDVNIGIAVAVDEGLVVPVLNNSEQKSLSQIAVEANELGGKAKNGKLQPAEMDGNTFTISNLGMAGIESFTSIINAPSSCILAVGAIRTEPVVKDGQIVIGHRMKVTMSCDHRSVDGAVGSDWLQTFKKIMENPFVHFSISNY